MVRLFSFLFVLLLASVFSSVSFSAVCYQGDMSDSPDGNGIYIFALNRWFKVNGPVYDGPYDARSVSSDGWKWSGGILNYITGAGTDKEPSGSGHAVNYDIKSIFNVGEVPGDCASTEPDHCSNLTKDEDETGKDCGGSCGECKWTCENGDEPVLNIVDGKKYCEVYSVVNPAGVCPDDYGRIEGTSECIYRYPASSLNSEYSSDLADYPDIPSNLPAEIDNTQESSATTVESETTTSPDGSVTQKTTETTKATDASGTTTDTTKTTETTTKPDGTKTEQVTTETKISTATGADGKTTTTATTNVYAADGTLLSSTTNTSTGSSSNSSGTGSPTKPTTMNVSLDLGPVTERIDKSNETLDDIKKTLSVDEADENAPIEKFNSSVENAIEDSQAELHDYMKGMEKPGFGNLPFNESINSEIGKFVPGGKTCTDLVFPYEFLGQSQTFVIECDNFETYLKPILTWVFYCFTAVMVYYSYTAPVGEN